MQKTRQNILKEKFNKEGLMWVKIPSMNYRQSTGVEYRGKYMTPMEYREYLHFRMLAKKTKEET